MTRALSLRVLALVAVLLLGVWVVMNYTLEQTTVEVPVSGEAAENPHYALEHLLRNVGVRLQRVSSLEAPPTHGVLLSDGYTIDTHGRSVDGLESWVRAGGHLIVGAGSAWRTPFQHWTDITPPRRPVDQGAAPTSGAASAARTSTPPPTRDPCFSVTEQAGEVSLEQSLCGTYPQLIASRHPPTWSLKSEQGLVGVSVAIGRGWVTVLPPLPWRELAEGGNAHIFLGALGVRRGDVVYLFEITAAESLLYLLWRLAAPGLLLLGAALLLLIVRALPRFGTAIPAPAALRRSLAEQIRATAMFAWRTRRLQALRRAVVRALEESAGRDIAAFRLLDSRRRAEVLATATGLAPEMLRAALYQDASAAPEVQRAAIATLEQARRRFLRRSLQKGGV